jgi:peptidoglycan/xylan/chitin deacetylase (PgdA/CDA1 family)
MMIEQLLERTSKVSLMRWALDAMYFSQIYRFFESGCSGVGAIFTLHHVVPSSSKQGSFNPNRILEVTPEFLEQTIKHVRMLEYDIVSLDEVRRRLLEKDFKRKFVCFTLDDGYADNYENAFPVFKKNNAKFTIYVATGILNGTAILWWIALERLIKKHDLIEVELDGKLVRYSTNLSELKYKAYYDIYWTIRHLPIDEQLYTTQKLFEKYEIDIVDLCSKVAMSWEMLSEMSKNGLVTIGAHTVKHFALSKLSAEKAREEANFCREIIAKQLGISPTHFSYPYGDAVSATTNEFKIIKELAFDTATTTRKGVLFPEHAQHLHALPRISLNGDYQKQRYVREFLSGAPFALLHPFRRVDVN